MPNPNLAQRCNGLQATRVPRHGQAVCPLGSPVATELSPWASLVEFHSMPTAIRHSELVPRKRSSTLVDQSIYAPGLSYRAMHGLTQLDLNVQGWPDPCKSDGQTAPSIIEIANHVS